MLAKANRLRESRDIVRTYKQGRYSSTAELTVNALQNKKLHSRAVVIISKKVAKKAVTRNLIRRRLQALFQSTWQTLAPGYDIVVTVRRDISGLSLAELEASLRLPMTKLALIKANNDLVSAKDNYV